MAITQGTFGIGKFKLPDLGATEWLVKKQPKLASIVPVNPNRTPSYSGGQTNFTLPKPSPTTNQPYQTPSGGYQAPSGGGGGGGYQDAPYEQAPEQPSFEDQYGNLFNEALSGIDQQIAARQAGSEGTVKELEGTSARQKQIVETGKTEALNELQKQQTREEGAAELANDEQRRQYSEMAQGIQAKFGGTTGTGPFATELLGRSVVQNITANRQRLAQTIQDINDTRTSTIEKAFQTMREVEEKTASLISQARNQLQQDLAEFSTQKGMLYAQRQQAKLDALQNYQSIVASINARNTAFKQQLFRDQQDFERQIEAKKLGAVKNHSTDLDKTLLSLFSKDKLSEQGVRLAEQRAGLPTGTLLNPDDEDDEIEEIADLFGTTSVGGGGGSF